ncbi:MAG: DUF935 family protein [Syntrophobacteraceae bacterium]
MVEIIWETSGSEVGIRGLRWVHPKRITFWDSLTPRVLHEEAPTSGIDPRPFKFVYHRCRVRSGYDTLAGIMRARAWMSPFKNHAVKDWVSFAAEEEKEACHGQCAPPVWNPMP